MERAKYYKHITKSRAHPEDFGSLIVDGMDQSKTMVSHMIANSKAQAAMHKFKVSFCMSVPKDR
jgi:hypothetical protein